VKANILQAYAKPEWPLVKSYLDRWPDSTVSCGAMPSLRYRTKLGFLLQLPRLLVFGFRIGFEALRGGSAPAVFVVHTDPEVIGLALAQFLRRKRVPIVICGFIYTLRKSRLLNWCRKLYFRTVLSRTQGVITHSKHETIRYAKIFRLKKRSRGPRRRRRWPVRISSRKSPPKPRMRGTRNTGKAAPGRL